MSDLFTSSVALTALVMGLVGPPRRRNARRWLRSLGSALAVGVGVMVLARVLEGARVSELPVLSLLVAAGGGGLLPPIASFAMPAAAAFGPRTGWLTRIMCAVILADLVVLDWVTDAHGRHALARAHLAEFGQGAGVVLLALLIARFIKEMQAREHEARHSRPVAAGLPPDVVDVGAAGWSRIAGLGIAAVAAGLAALAEVARRTGLDTTARAPGWPLWAWIAVAAAIVVGAGALALMVPPAGERGARRIDIGARTFAACLGLVAVWGIAPHVFVHSYHEIAAATALSLLLGLTSLHSFWFHLAGEHHVPLGGRGRAINVVHAIATMSVTFWLLSAGLWQSGRSIVAADADKLAVSTIVAGGLLTTLVVTALAKRRIGERLSGYPTPQQIGYDTLTFSGGMLVLGVVPAIVVAHLRYTQVSGEALWTLWVAVIAGFTQAMRFGRLTYRTINSFLNSYVSHIGSEAARTDRHFRLVEQHFRWLLRFGVTGITLSLLWIATSART